MECAMTIDFQLIAHYWPNLMRGALVSLQIAAIGCAMGIILGTLLGLLQATGNTFFRTIIGIYVTILRGTPMLIQIAFAVFVLPQFGIVLPDFWAATLAIGFNSSAYLSQIIRAGIKSVGKGQWEAAHVLGFSHIQAIRFIILPQAIRVVIPALGNEFITLIKDSSLASTVGVMELSKEAAYIKNSTYDALTTYCIVAIIYLFMTSILSLIMHLIERRMNRSVAH
jgi:His/Glu/Gln/Arg/opine family amino acid ABC transporter permease subunit